MDPIAKLIEARDKLSTLVETEKDAPPHVQTQLSLLVSQLSEIISEMEANIPVLNLGPELNRTTSHRFEINNDPGPHPVRWDSQND